MVGFVSAASINLDVWINVIIRRCIITPFINIEESNAMKNEYNTHSLSGTASVTTKENRKRRIMTWGLGLLAFGAVLALVLYVSLKDNGHIEVSQTMTNGNTFTGKLLHGKPYGDGKLTLKDGTVYTGTWGENGQLLFGTMNTPEFTYSGEFHNYLPEGYGICSYKDGRVYRGYYKEGQPDGLGMIAYEDSKIEFGEWNKGILMLPKGMDFVQGHKVYGIDVSKYQKFIDWRTLSLPADRMGAVFANLSRKKVKGPGSTPYMQPVLFAVMKSTEGSTVQDPTFPFNFTEAKESGLIRGAYHFLSPSSDVEDQVQNYIANTPLEPGDLPPILDIEVSNKVMKKDSKRICAMALQWLKEIEQYYGVKPIIYTYNNYYESYMKDGRFNDYMYWLARYSDTKPDARNWEIWQFTENGRCAGIETPVDVDFFKGNYNFLIKYVDGNGIKGEKKSMEDFLFKHHYNHWQLPYDSIKNI